MGKTVAITGVSGYIGQKLLQQLEADDTIDRVIGSDIVAPPETTKKLEFHIADIRDADFTSLWEDVDCVVHLAFVLNPMQDEKLMYEINIGGLRHVLDAVADAAVAKLVYTSSASAYGAREDNPVPLAEDDKLRASPDFNYAYHKAESERVITAWHESHPEVLVTILRPAIVFGPGVANFISEALAGPFLPLVKGYKPPLQVIHEDDVASALHHAVSEELPGIFNVGSDDSVEVDDLIGLAGRPVREIPPKTARWLQSVLWTLGLAGAPKGQVDYFMHPFVVANDKLKETGWKPQHTSREAIEQAIEVNRDYVAFGPIRMTRDDWRGRQGLLAIPKLGAHAARSLVRRLPLP